MTVVTNSHIKVVQLRKSHERPIYLRVYSSVQINLLLQEKGGTPAFHKDLGLSIRSQLKETPNIPVILVNWWIIVNFLPSPPHNFPKLGFHIKILCLHPVFVLCLLFCTYILNTHYCLWCGLTVWSLAAKNLHHMDVENQIVMKQHLTILGLFFTASIWRKLVDWED